MEKRLRNEVCVTFVCMHVYFFILFIYLNTFLNIIRKIKIYFIYNLNRQYTFILFIEFYFNT